MFEEAARAHAVRLVAKGELPDDMIVGRWWATSGEPCEIDVLGMRGSRTHLAGEVRWQARPLGRRDLAELVARARRAPEPVDEVTYALWGRVGVDDQVIAAGALGFSVEQVVQP